MELKEFLFVLRKNWMLITLITAVCVVVAAIITRLIPSKYVASIDVYVTRKATQESDQYYTYDGYYSTRSSVQYTDTVSGLFQSLQIVRDAALEVQEDNSYVKAVDEPENLSSDVDYLRKISKRITVEDVAPQVINVSFKHGDIEKSKLWVSSLGEVVQNKVVVLNKESDGNFRVDVSPEPLVEEVNPSLIINIVVSLMSGLLIGVLWSFGKEYFKMNGKS